MQKLDETNQKGACRSLARKAKGRAVVYKTTAVAAALLALGFMSLPSAMASAESQIISNTTKTYTTGLSVDSAVSGPNEEIDSQSGLYVLENATVTGENALTIKAADNNTPPRLLQRSRNR
jgi:hypothetical protein